MPILARETRWRATGEAHRLALRQCALERGWNVLMAEGPGQTGFLRFHPDVVFRPDYEVPVGGLLILTRKRT